MPLNRPSHSSWVQAAVIGQLLVISLSTSRPVVATNPSLLKWRWIRRACPIISLATCRESWITGSSRLWTSRSRSWVSPNTICRLEEIAVIMAAIVIEWVQISSKIQCLQVDLKSLLISSRSRCSSQSIISLDLHSLTSSLPATSNGYSLINRGKLALSHKATSSEMIALGLHILLHRFSHSTNCSNRCSSCRSSNNSSKWIVVFNTYNFRTGF